MTAPIRLPAGVRDYLPRAAARRRAIGERLIEAFSAWGYQRIITPLFEYADVLERGLGADARRAAIRFVEPLTGEIVALRPDITPQVARIAATRLAEVGGPLRLCYEGGVTRLAPGARGQREVLQAGVELIGVPTPEGDAEALSVAAAALASMRVDDVRLDVGHVALARAALDGLEGERREVLEHLLGKKDRTGVAREAAGLPAARRELIAALPTLYGAPAATLRRARELSLPATARRALATIEQVLALARLTMDAEQHRRITIDLGEVRGFEYYTGLRFAGYAHGVGDAVLRGGRYDELMARYGSPAAATGFAVDIEAIAQTERSAGIAAPVDDAALLIVPARDQRPLAARLATALRAAGYRCAVDGHLKRAAVAGYAEAAGFSRVLAIAADGSGEVVAGGATTAVSRTALARAARGHTEVLDAALGRGAEEA